MNTVVARLHFLLHLLRSIVWTGLDGIVIAFAKLGLNEKRVLIIRTDRIGDFVLWSGAARELTVHFRQQGLRVTLLANAAWAAWAQDLGIADEVWAIEPVRFARSLPYRWEWIVRLRSAGFAQVLQPVHSRHFLIDDALVRATGAPERVAPNGDCSNIERWQKRWSDRWYSKLIPEASAGTMELVRHAEFMRALGFARFLARVPQLPRTQTRVLDGVAMPYALLFLGASWDGKAWEAEKFADIAERFQRSGIHVVLGGSASDKNRALSIAKVLRQDVISLVGKTELGDLAELARHAVMVLTNDTSAVHIAAAAGGRAVCIVGGGQFGRFLPYVVEAQDEFHPKPHIVVKPMSCFGCSWHCVHPRRLLEPVKCISDISADEVWHVIEKSGFLQGRNVYTAQASRHREVQ